MPRPENLFDSIPPGGFDEEHFLELAGKEGATRIERIVSRGHASPPGGQWYDQDRDEWVIVLRGAAILEFEAGSESIELGPGDHVTIPAHARHRVTWTDPETETVWLAVHF